MDVTLHSPRRCRSTTSPLAPARAAWPSASLGAWPPLPARDWERPGQQPPRCEADGAHAGSRSVSRLGLSRAARGRLHGPAAFTHRQLRPLLTSSHSRATGLVSWRWVEARQRLSRSPGATGASPPAAASPSLLPSLLPSIAHLIPPGRVPPHRQRPRWSPRASGPGCGVCSILSRCPVPSTLCSITLHGATLCLVSSPLFLAPP